MCTDVVIEENTYYMVLKKLDGYDWSMLMLVPTLCADVPAGSG